MPILTPEERVGTIVAGKYRLDRILAQGGMGTVFGGQHEWTHRPVAVKLLNYEHARNPEIVKRFLQEARAAATLTHSNVVDVLDMGEDQDGTVYMVLELLEGRTLRAHLREAGRLELGELVEILGPVMDALAAAHRRGVVHRDLKPDNVFLTYDEDGRVIPKLLDFGIAKVRDGDSTATGTGVMIGTPQYMAPEQVRGDRDVGAPADVWSMGVLLYVALSGRMPFSGDAAATILAKVLTERPPPLRVVAPHVPPEVAGVVDRALSAAPEARFADMAEMAAALRRAVDAPPSFEASDAAAWSEDPSTEVTQATPPPAALDPSELPMVNTVQLDVADLTPEPSEVSLPQPKAAPASDASQAEPSSTPFTWGTASEPSAQLPRRGGLMWLALGGIGVLSVAIGAGTVVLFTGGDEEPPARPLAAPRVADPEPAIVEVPADDPPLELPSGAPDEARVPTEPVEPVAETTEVAPSAEAPAAEAAAASSEPPPRTDAIGERAPARGRTGASTRGSGVTRAQRGTRGALILR